MGERRINPRFNVNKIYKTVNIINPYRFPVAGGGGSSLDLASLVFKVDETSVDSGATSESDPVTIWEDLANGNDAVGDVTNPVLHIGSVGSARQVRFNGATDGLDVGTPSVLDFTPGTDSFSFVIKFGDFEGDEGFVIHKGGGSSSSKEYAIWTTDGHYYIYLGGSVKIQSFTRASNELAIITISDTSVNIYVDGTQILTNYTGFGTTTSTENVYIGARNSGLSDWNGDLDFLCIYNSELTSDERADIFTEFQEN